MSGLADIAARTVEHQAMLPAGAPVVAMVSGGADSVAALHLLASGALGPVRLLVLHVNHLLRGAESDDDEAFVRELAARLGVPCKVLRYDVSAFAAASDLNLEDAGRRVRYRFAEEQLDAWCEACDCDPSRGRVVVAHTLDDRVETFFMRALAGSGAKGLSSIAAVRGRIVRPLIEAEREQVRQWLTTLGETWREDPSNADTSRLRAHVRAELMPVAERIAPGFRARVARSMDLLAADDALLGSMAEAFARDFAETQPSEEVAFRRDWMLTLDRAMARRTVRGALVRAFPDASRIEAEHIDAIIDGLGADGFARDLPGGLRAFTEYDRLVICRADALPVVLEPSLLPVPGEVELGGAGSLVAEVANEGDTSGTPDSVVIDLGKVNGELVVDSVRPGDRISPLGMQGSRKVSDLLIDAKIPKRLRAAVPVIRDGEHVAWVAGVRMSERYRVTPETSRSARLTWKRSDVGSDE